MEIKVRCPPQNKNKNKNKMPTAEKGVNHRIKNANHRIRGQPQNKNTNHRKRCQPPWLTFLWCDTWHNNAEMVWNAHKDFLLFILCSLNNFHKYVESFGYLEQHKLHKDFQRIIWILDVISLPPVKCHKFCNFQDLSRCDRFGNQLNLLWETIL